MSDLNLELLRFIGYVDGVLGGAESLEQARQIIGKDAERLTSKGTKRTKGLTFNEAVSAHENGHKVTRSAKGFENAYLHKSKYGRFGLRVDCYLSGECVGGSVSELTQGCMEATDWEIVLE